MVTAVLVALLGARVLDRRAGVLAGLFAALSGPAVFHEAMLLKAALSLVLFTGALLAWLGLLRGGGLAARRPRTAALLTGVLLGIGILLRGNLYLLMGLVLLSLVAWRPRRPGLAGLVLAGALLALAPATLHNLSRGEAVLTTYQSGTNAAIGMPDSDLVRRGVYYEPLRAGRGDARYEEADAVALAEAGAGRPLASPEVSTWWWSRWRERVAARPGVALQRTALKLAHLFHGKEPGDVKDWPFFRARLVWLASPLSDFDLLGPLALLGFLLLPWRDRGVNVVRGGVAVVGVTLALFYVMGRYRLTAAPCLWVLAAGGTLLLLRTLAGPASPARKLGTALLALALLAAGNTHLVPLLPDPDTGEHEPQQTAWANYASAEMALATLATDAAAADAHRERGLAAARRALDGHELYAGARATLMRLLDLDTAYLDPRREEAWLEAWRLLLVAECQRTGLDALAALDGGVERLSTAVTFLLEQPSLPGADVFTATSRAVACRRVAQDLRRPDEWLLALQLLDSSLASQPDEPLAHVQRAWVLRRLGRLDEALTDTRAALDAGLDSVELHNNHGNLLLDLDRPAEAMAAFERALALDPEQPVVRANLERARARLP